MKLAKDQVLGWAAAVFAGIVVSGASVASSVTATGTSPLGMDPGATSAGGTPTTIQFLAEGPDTVSSTGSFSQGLQVVSGYDPVGGPVSFSTSENFTIDGITKSVAISGVMNVSSTADPDSITINSGGPVVFGNEVLSVVGQSFNDVPPYNNPPGAVGTYDGSQSFTLTPVPLPAAGLLLLSGSGGLGFFARRRKSHKV